MKIQFITLITILISTFSFAQEPVQEDSSIVGQFDKIYRTSTTYQTYKVISKEKYLQLKQNVLDSLKESKKILIEKENLLKVEKDNIQKTQNTLSKTQLDLETALNKENSMSLFGLQLSKTSYNLILWAIILLLFFGLLYFAYQFSKNNIVTKDALNNLVDVEQEFEKYRKKSLEREQKLRRQLQDEINKQKNN